MHKISKALRKYDLKKIKKQEIEDLNLTIGNLKSEWTRLKRSLHEKSKFVEKIQKRHKEEVETYEEFCDYLEPGSLKDKLKKTIKDLDRKSSEARKPVKELEKELQWL